MRLNRVRVIPGRGCVCGVVGHECRRLSTVSMMRVCQRKHLGWCAGVGDKSRT